MFNTEIAKKSLMNFPHVVTKHTKSSERWLFITQLATVLQKIFICIFYIIIAKSNFILSLKQSIRKHSVSKLFVWLDGFREHDLDIKKSAN